MTAPPIIVAHLTLAGSAAPDEVRIVVIAPGVVTTSATVQRQRPPVGQTPVPGLPPLPVVVSDVEAP